MNRYIVSMYGMPYDQCMQLEQELNEEGNNKFWVFDKLHSFIDVKNNVGYKYIVSAEGMPNEEIERLEGELNDSTDKKFWVVDKNMSVSALELD